MKPAANRLDALSSAAYGPEAALTLLIPPRIRNRLHPSDQRQHHRSPDDCVFLVLMSPAAVPAEPMQRAPASAGSSQPAADLNALIAKAAKDLADRQRLTAEGKLGEAGQKLAELKRKLNTRQR